MKTIEIDDGTYEFVLKMARLTDETMEYILHRSVMREYVQGDEYREKEGGANENNKRQRHKILDGKE